MNVVVSLGKEAKGHTHIIELDIDFIFFVWNYVQKRKAPRSINLAKVDGKRKESESGKKIDINL